MLKALLLSLFFSLSVFAGGNFIPLKFDQLSPQEKKEAIRFCKEKGCDPKKLTYYKKVSGSTPQGVKPRCPSKCFKCRWGGLICVCDPSCSIGPINPN